MVGFLVTRRHDQTRYVPGAEDYIVDALNWCNIKVDEGVGVGGELGPYRQSERKEMYRQYADRLISSGHYAFDTPEELEEMQKSGMKNGEFPLLNTTKLRVLQ